MKSHVMHNLPGRLRLAASGLKYLKEQSGEIAAELARLPGVRLARVTACTGGILLQYDGNMLDAHELAEQVDLVLARHAMTALRTRHSENNEAPAEAPMTTVRRRRQPRPTVEPGSRTVWGPMLLHGSRVTSEPIQQGASTSTESGMGSALHTPVDCWGRVMSSFTRPSRASSTVWR